MGNLQSQTDYNKFSYRLPEGEEWHNPDQLRPSQFPIGFRPLYKSELDGSLKVPCYYYIGRPRDPWVRKLRTTEQTALSPMRTYCIRQPTEEEFKEWLEGCLNPELSHKRQNELVEFNAIFEAFWEEQRSLDGLVWDSMELMDALEYFVEDRQSQHLHTGPSPALNDVQWKQKLTDVAGCILFTEAMFRIVQYEYITRYRSLECQYLNDILSMFSNITEMLRNSMHAYYELCASAELYLAVNQNDQMSICVAALKKRASDGLLTAEQLYLEINERAGDH